LKHFNKTHELCFGRPKVWASVASNSSAIQITCDGLIEALFFIQLFLKGCACSDRDETSFLKSHPVV